MHTQELLEYLLVQLLKCRAQDNAGQLAMVKGTINDILVTLLLELD